MAEVLRDPSFTVAAAVGGVVFAIDEVAAASPSFHMLVHSTRQFKGRPRRSESSICLVGERVDSASQCKHNADLGEPDPILAVRK